MKIAARFASAGSFEIPLSPGYFPPAKENSVATVHT